MTSSYAISFENVWLQPKHIYFSLQLFVYYNYSVLGAGVGVPEYPLLLAEIRLSFLVKASFTFSPFTHLVAGKLVAKAKPQANVLNLI